MTSATTKVTFAIDQTTADGKKRKADTTASIPAAEARELIYWGHARLADTTPVADTTTPAETSTVDDGESTEGKAP